VSNTRWIPALIAGILAMVLAACTSSSTTLSNVDTLAKAGQAAAQQMEQNAIVSASAVTQVRVAVAFDDGYNNVVGNPASSGYLANITAAQAAMQQYAKMLESLSAAYAALGSLASYDASGNFNTAIGTLGKDAQTFLTTVKSKEQIPSDVTSAIGAVGGAIIGGIQASKAKEASSKIEAVLKQVITVLQNPSTKAVLVGVLSDVQDHIKGAAEDVYKAGIYSYTPVLNQVGAPLGFTANSTADAKVQGSIALKRAFFNVEDELVNEQYAAIGDSYDKSVKALQALIPMHDALQADAPINAQSIEAFISQLQGLATSIQPPKGTKP
jgi:hypothetical protein